MNLVVESLYCEPENFVRDDENIKKLAAVIAKEPDAVLTKIPANGKFVSVERKLEPDIVERVKDLHIKGLGFMNEAKRVDPKGKLLAYPWLCRS